MKVVAKKNLIDMYSLYYEVICYLIVGCYGYKKNLDKTSVFPSPIPMSCYLYSF